MLQGICLQFSTNKGKKFIKIRARQIYYTQTHLQTSQSWCLAAKIWWNLAEAGTVQLDQLQRLTTVQIWKDFQISHIGKNSINYYNAVNRSVQFTYSFRILAISVRELTVVCEMGLARKSSICKCGGKSLSFSQRMRFLPAEL